jgi:phosphate transport system substrate-binding protein
MFFNNSKTIPSGLTKAMSVIALSVSLVACGGGEQAQNGTEASPGAATDTAATTTRLELNERVSLTGAGASFPAPLYTTWFQNLNKKYPNLQINYQSTGSGAGVEQFIKETVDFAASDVAVTPEEAQKVTRGVLTLPMTAGAIVLAYNLPGVEQQIRLPRQVYTDILLGNIKSWDDPAIAKANPGVNLPNQPITVVHRSDGSGTTAVFTQHLSAVSPQWKEKVGSGKTVNWPAGVGAKGNEGVTAQIQQTQGAIGYVEYGYAQQNKLQTAALENKSGNFVAPSGESASRTLESITLPEDLRAFEFDPEGNESYPIVTYTWLLLYNQYPNAVTAKALEAMVEYGLTEGQKVAPELGYVQLPPAVVEKVAAAADKISPEYNIEVAAGSNSGSSTTAAKK